MLAAKTDTEAVRSLHAAGRNDSQIAAVLGWDRGTVGQMRRRLGLPVAFDRATQGRKFVRLAIATRLDRMDTARREFAARYGLPSDLKATQVDVILVLLDGPATAEMLAERCSRGKGGSYRPGFDRFRCDPRSGRNNYLTDLCRRGLITRIPGRRGKGNGSGWGFGLYMLTAACLDLLVANLQPEGSPRP